MTQPHNDLQPLLETIFGDTRAYAGLFSGKRVNGRLTDQREQYLAYPAAAASIHSWVAGQVAAGREVYLCAHPLNDRRRRKEDAAPIRSLYADGDDAPIPTGALAPTLVIESSPGRWHGYWALTRPIAPEAAETLNKRLAALIGADASGYDLTQLLRPPGTRNNKHPGAPLVRTLSYNPEHIFDPENLGYVLPPTPATIPRRIERAERVTCADDEPPVELDDSGLAVYRGQQPKVKRDGTGQIDRSASLLKIGRVLYNAGMTRRGVVDALAERDRTLGYCKYSDRPDAAEQYHRVMDQLEHEGRRRRSGVPPSVVVAQPGSPAEPTVDPSCPAQLAAVLQENATLRAENTRLVEEHRMLVLTTTNPHLKAEVATIIPAVMEAHRQRRAGKVDEKGFILLTPARISDDHAANPAPIRSRSTASRHLAKAAELGLLEREVRPGVVEKIVRDREGMPIVDPQTGKPRRKPFTTDQTWIRLTGESIAEMLKPFALFAPAERGTTRQHGGDRRSATFQATRQPCSACGSTERHTFCGGCGVDITEVAEAETAELQTRIQLETRRRRHSTPPEEATAFQVDPHKETAPPSVDRFSAFQDETRSDRAGRFKVSAPADTLAGAWQRGRSYPHGGAD